MKQNKDREEFEKILFNFGTFYEELPQTVRGRKRALKEMDKLWKMFQSYTQKKVEEARTELLEEIMKIIEVNVHVGSGYTDECDKNQLIEEIKKL